ncbi:MAG: hypothetical protein WD602_01240 [Actinomycetota bacterium]
MNKFTRVCAAGLTSVVALGVFAVPAGAAEAGDPSTAESICEYLAVPTTEAAQQLETLNTRLAEEATAITEARTAFDAATGVLTTTTLAYFEAIDAEAGVNGAAGAYEDAVIDFVDDMIVWLEAVDAHADTTMEVGVYEIILDYWTGLCPAAV